MIKNLDLMLAEVGKIKIGTKGDLRKGKNGDYRMPVKLSHFLITTMGRDRNDLLIPDAEMMEKYGEKPTELDIMFMSDDIEEIFQTSYALFAGSKCKCRGDGETAIRVNRDGSSEKIKCDTLTCPFYADENSKAKCKMNGVLSCLLSKSTRLGGVYKFRTTGFHSVRNVLSSLAFIQKLTGGRLAAIPFKLTLAMKTSSKPGVAPFYAVNVVYQGTANEMLECVINEAKNRALLKHDMKMLELKVDTIDGALSPEEMKDITEEFYPENQENYPHPAKATVEALPEPVVVVDNETGEVKDSAAVIPNKETSEEIAKKIKKENLNKLRNEVSAMYGKLATTKKDQRDLNFTMLGTAEVVSSRTEGKLIQLRDYLMGVLEESQPLADDGEEL